MKVSNPNFSWPKLSVFLSTSVLIVLLVSCGMRTETPPSAIAQLSTVNAEALEDLKKAAQFTAGKEEDTREIQCWSPPSQHLTYEGDSTTIFSVICRVNYVKTSVDRYIDLTCIGDFDATPMLDHCYYWHPYPEAVRFEAHPSA